MGALEITVHLHEIELRQESIPQVQVAVKVSERVWQKHALLDIVRSFQPLCKSHQLILQYLKACLVIG